jgi:hypothetical protein
MTVDLEPALSHHVEQAARMYGIDATRFVSIAIQRMIDNTLAENPNAESMVDLT